ncbi:PHENOLPTHIOCEROL SYNTHESIS TYPE-I POLYKETIDE SYNTHASE PPSC, partial [Plesiocystis pacifica SIR-1]
QTLAWGLGGPLRSEHGGLRPLRVDLGARPSAPEDPEVRALVELLARDGDEDQVALRSTEVFVARLERAPVPAAAKGRKVAAGERAFRVEIGQPGLLESIELTAFDRPALEAGQVEIAVEAVGMNFRDVLLANGVIPPVGSERVLLGFECAGTVARVGEGVDGLEPGQRVFGIAFDSFATHAVTRAELVVPLPERLSMAEGATLPIVHLTTYVSLHETARLRPGERVLIHSATGGVGLSALQWAQHVGAEIYATAGSETKRDWLREQGVQWVSDSRSLRFVDDIRRWTRDEAAAGKGEPGVDVVLNALAGELMHGSLGLLRRGGRFIELGLRGALSNERIGLAPFANNLAYFLVNLADLTVHAPARAGALLRELVPLLEQDVLRPLPILPHLMSRVGDAMWEMARGRHIGKFVVHVDGTEAAREAFPDAPPVRVNVPRGASLVRGDRSYLITGGLGGLGLELAKRLAERGAGALVLLSRRGVTQDHQREAIAAMREAGVVVETPSVDVSDRAALEAEFEAIAASPRPLGGIVHTAGVLADAMAVDLRPEDFERSFAPKVAGAWHLDELSRSHAPELELFVLYSSVAGILGNPGQTNYSAANAFLDGLAARRRRAGLPAHAIAWGVFDEVGFATGDARRGARLAARGLTPLRPAEGLDLFEQVVAGDEALLAPCPFDAHKWAGFYTEAASWPFFAELLVREAGDQGGRAEDELSERLRQVSTREARPILLEHVLEQLAQVIRIDPAELDPDAPFAALGVDSLMGVELRNLVAASTGVTVPATAIWTYPTPEALTGFILEALDLEAEPESEADAPEPESEPAPSPTPAPLDEEEELLEELEDLSDEDLLALGDELLS